MEQKKLGFGCMRLPLTDPEDQKSIDLEQMCRMTDTFLEKGFTYLIRHICIMIMPVKRR